MANQSGTARCSSVMWALALSFAFGPSLSVHARDTGEVRKLGSTVFSPGSLKGLYAYANLAQIKAGYGILKLDGRGNLSTDDITLNRPDEPPNDDTRLVTRLGPGTGTYAVGPDGVGTLEVTFTEPEPDITFQYEFVIKKGVSGEKQRVPLATEVFTASATTGVANASVTFISPLHKKTNAPVAKFNVGSLDGRYAYTNNADFFASYGVLVFDGKGNVHSDGPLRLNAPTELDGREIKLLGPGYGTYAVGPDGRGSFNMKFDDLAGREFTWEFVITGTSDEGGRHAELATEIFSVVTDGGVAGQLVAPVLTRIFSP